MRTSWPAGAATVGMVGAGACAISAAGARAGGAGSSAASTPTSQAGDAEIEPVTERFEMVASDELLQAVWMRCQNIWSFLCIRS